MEDDRPQRYDASAARRRTIRWVALLCLLIGLVACGDIQVRIPEALVTPTVAGVIVQAIPQDGLGRTLVLASGSKVEVDEGTIRVILGSGSPDVGDLLLTDAAGTWVAWLKPNALKDVPPGCFRLEGLARDDGDFISFTNGLRLPKSAGFVPGIGGREGLYRVPQSSFCVDETAAITSYQ